jgi:hypothetical protein
MTICMVSITIKSDININQFLALAIEIVFGKKASSNGTIVQLFELLIK